MLKAKDEQAEIVLKEVESSNLRNVIIERISQRMQLPASTIESVVSHQFKGISKALQTHRSVEMSGFGKWLFLPKRAERMLEVYKNLKDDIINNREIKSFKTKNIPLEQVEKEIAILEEKINKP